MFKVFRNVSKAIQWIINNEIHIPLPIAELREILRKKDIYANSTRSLIIIIDKYGILD